MVIVKVTHAETPCEAWVGGGGCGIAQTGGIAQGRSGCLTNAKRNGGGRLRRLVCGAPPARILQWVCLCCLSRTLLPWDTIPVCVCVLAGLEVSVLLFVNRRVISTHTNERAGVI